MAETTADVRRDIELTRERMSDTLAQLESKVNVMHAVRDHPWATLALAAGAGFALARSKADVKAAAATVSATGGASSKLGEVLDDLAARLITEVTAVANEQVDEWVAELKEAIGAVGDSARKASSRKRVRSEREVERRIAREEASGRRSEGRMSGAEGGTGERAAQADELHH